MRIEDVTAKYFSKDFKDILLIRVYYGAAGDVAEFQTDYKFPVISGGTYPLEQSVPAGKPGVLRLEQLKDTGQKYSNFRVIDNDIYDTGDLRKQAEVNELEKMWSTT